MSKFLPGLCALAVLSSSPAMAADAPQAQPQTESRRIAALEARIQALETELQAIRTAQQAATLAPPTTTAPALVTSPADEIEALAADPGDAASAPTQADDTATLAASADSGSGGGANAFNPAISIILNGSYSHHSLDPDAYARSGFPLAGESGPSANGFSLGESEISFAANIDDKFYGQLTLAMESEDGEDHLGVEEAYIDTTALPDGLSLRAGRFFSNIGYLNSHHAHTDNFFDRPLAYQAFLGGQYGDDGVQLRWVAPTALFLELGGEVFRGQAFPSGGAQHGGIGARTLFAHLGGDVG